MVEVICGERASGPPGLPCTARPGAWALRLTASAVPHAAAGPGPEGAGARVEKRRATHPKQAGPNKAQDHAMGRYGRVRIAETLPKVERAYERGNSRGHMHNGP